MSAHARWIIVFLLLLGSGSLALAQPSATPSVPGNTVPAWVFYWVLGLGTAGAIIWSAITKVLWDRGNKVSALSEEERTWLREIHNIRSEVPKAWSDLFDEFEDTLKKSQTTLKQLVALMEGDKADLQAQLRERLELHDRQQAKMLKLAVRVQRAVEALAGLEKPVIESDLVDNDDEEDS